MNRPVNRLYPVGHRYLEEVGSAILKTKTLGRFHLVKMICLIPVPAPPGAIHIALVVGVGSKLCDPRKGSLCLISHVHLIAQCRLIEGGRPPRKPHTASAVAGYVERLKLIGRGERRGQGIGYRG